MSPLSKIAYAVTAAAVLATATEPTSHADAAAMQYLGQWQLPHEAFIGGTRIGGLSGISYDAQRGVYYAISDDKSTFGKVRLYTVRLALSSKGIDDAQFVGTQPLLDESGNPFRAEDDAANPPVVAPDAEGIAFDDARQQIYWTSEGFAKKSTNGGERVLANPWIRVAGLDGTYRGEFTLPPGFAYSPDGSSGPRPNNALEGLSLSPDGRFLFAAMEAPLLQDGPAVNADHGALIRITKFDIESRTPVAQYAYRVEASPPPTRFNGVSDILTLSDTSFLVVERAATLPDLAVSIYRADVDSATDTLHMPSLSAQPVTPMTKTLATDLNAVPGLKPLDNIEGITLGPKMPDGHQSVLLVSDDNFSPSEVTQFLAFAI